MGVEDGFLSVFDKERLMRKRMENVIQKSCKGNSVTA